MNINDVEAQLHSALDGRPYVLDSQLDDPDEVVRLAEKLKAEQPEKYGRVRVWKTGDRQVSFSLEQGLGTE